MEPRFPMPAAAPSTGPSEVASTATTGGPAFPELARAFDAARAWAGNDVLALVLTGSHASGEAVWTTWNGRRITLSDVDLYAILRDDAACARATARRRADTVDAGALLEAGLAAPLEVGFLTREGFGRAAARPGTLEIARRARVVFGDAGVLRDAPAWTAEDVPFEETLLLLENRGFDLLVAHAARAHEGLDALRARHAVLKAAADLAGVLALECRQWPVPAAQRLAWAAEHALPGVRAGLPAEWQDAAAALPRLWSTALAWKQGDVRALAPAEAAEEWRQVARAWCAVWWHLGRTGERDPWPRALKVAARAPLPRRLRRAFTRVRPDALAEPLAARLRHGLAGTPQHRLDASAAVLLLAAAVSRGAPALPAGALRALRVLGVTNEVEWPAARREVVRAWEERVLGVAPHAEDAA